MKHILEIKFEEKVFSFLDLKGKMIDYLLEKTQYGKIKISSSGSRIDIVSNDLKEMFFFSIENFGFQIEGAKDFKQFSEKTLQIFNLISEFKNYKYGKPLRIGTKSSIFFHKPGMSLEGIKQKFINQTVRNKDELEKITGSKIIDTGLAFLDLTDDFGKSHLTVGPASKNEVISRFFGLHPLYRDFGKENGVYFELDYFQDNSNKINTNLENQVLFNISKIEEKFNNFISYLLGEKKNAR